MLNQQDRDAINGLFDRIGNVARSSGPRDAEAEALIRQRLHEAPAAPYYMAQTIVVQDQALKVAEERIAELEAQVSQRPRGPWGDTADYGETRRDQRGSGGGFLAGAAQTAMGVAGGMLLGSAIAGLFTGGAQAQEYEGDNPADQPEDEFDTGMDDVGDFDVGGDF